MEARVNSQLLPAMLFPAGGKQQVGRGRTCFQMTGVAAEGIEDTALTATETLNARRIER